MEKLLLDDGTYYLLSCDEYDILKSVYRFLSHSCYDCCFRHKQLNRDELLIYIRNMKGVLYA